MTYKEKLDAIRAEIHRLVDVRGYDREMANDLFTFMDSLPNESVSEKKCMFTKDNYTDEDRKVLCDGCEEECEYSKKEEPVSENLEDAAELYMLNQDTYNSHVEYQIKAAFKAGAKWQLNKIRKKYGKD